jgi:hypothetical protein
LTWCPTTPREHVEKRKLENRQFALVSAFLERSVQSKLVTHGSEAWTGRPRGYRASTGHPGRFWPFLARNGQKTTRNGKKRPETPASDAPSGPPALPTCVSPHRIPLVAVRGGHTANWWRLLLARAVPVIDLVPHDATRARGKTEAGESTICSRFGVSRAICAK